MKINPIIYIFFNYIISLSVLVYAIIKKISLFEYLTNSIFLLICTNIIYLSVVLIKNSLKIKDETPTFQLDIEPDIHEIKELLKEEESDDINKQEEEHVMSHTDEDTQLL